MDQEPKAKKAAANLLAAYKGVILIFVFVRRVCVENAAPVQYGDLLFELEPLNGRPLDAL